MALLVYKLTCEVSGKAYVGITARSLGARWFEHCSRSRNSDRESRLYAAMRKYGLDCWTRDIIDSAETEDDARILECLHIEALGTFADGYNANEGGCGSLIVSAETRKNIGDGRRGIKGKPEGRANMSAAKTPDKCRPGNFGDHLEKGAKNPRAAAYLIRFPNGTKHIVQGLREFCRRTGAYGQTLRKGQCSNGYIIVSVLNRIDASPADNTSSTGVV